MTKTQFKEALRNIKSRFVSWLSVVVVTMMAVGCFLGAFHYSRAVAETATAYYAGQSFKDIDVLGSHGVTRMDIEQILALDSVADAEGFHLLNATIETATDSEVIDIIRLTERISVPQVEEGTLPVTESECALPGKLMDRLSLSTGDTIILTATGKQNELLRTNTFTVTARVNHPDYLLNRDALIAVLPDAAFDMSSLDDAYLRAIIRLDLPGETDVLSEAYFTTVLPVENAIREILEENRVTREETIRQRAQESFEEAENETEEALAKGRKELSGAEEELRESLDEAERKLEEGEEQLREGETMLSDGERQLSAGERDYAAKENEVRTELANAKAELEEKRKQLEEAEPLLKQGEQTLLEAEAVLKDGESEYHEGLREYEDKKAELDKREQDARAQIEANRAKLRAVEAKLQPAKALLETVETKLKENNHGVLPAVYTVFRDKAIATYRPVVEAEIKGEDASAAEANARAAMEQDIDYILIIYGPIIRLQTGMTDAELKPLLFDVCKLYAANPVLEQAERDLEQAERELDAQLAPYKQKLAEGEKDLKKARDKLDEGWRQFYDGVNEYYAKKREYEAGKKALAEAEPLLVQKEAEANAQLAQAKQQLIKAANDLESKRLLLEEKKEELEEGRTQYQKAKTEGEQKLADAKLEFETEESNAREALAEAQESIRSVTCRYLVQNRRSNAGFMTLLANLRSTRSAAISFAVMFLLVGALVCFSTLTIIIDEQKKMIGATKALGLFNKEILRKYLVFSSTAIFSGIFLGIFLSLVLEKVFVNTSRGIYVFGDTVPVFKVLPAVLISVAELAVATIASAIACSRLLRLPAVKLMSGDTGQTRVVNNSGSEAGTLYSRLIGRNMLTEIERVLVSVFIVACSCGMIGIGFTLKFAFSRMMDHQIDEIQRYDLKLSCNADMTQEEKDTVERILRDGGASFVTAAEEGLIYRTGNLQEYAYVFVADREIYPDYFLLTDEKGHAITLPENGVLLQLKLSEKTKLKTGDTLTIYDATLEEKEVTVAGVFLNRLGRTMMMSREGYRALFGKDAVDNRYLVHLNGADADGLISALSGEVPGIVAETPEQARVTYDNIRKTYDLIVYVMTFLAVLMSVFVLSNLTNIFVNRRKRELVIMRVNGFSVRQTIGYLLRETLMTVLIGFVLSVIFGAVIARLLLFVIEPPDIMFWRAFSPLAWVLAVLMEAAFAGIINFLAFRKVRTLKLTDATAA